ncbi:MAG: thiamine phosphate synthase [Bacteroidales bacterium]|nr:thiamine phosphate synthase [Bacteroidales bacterium]MBN2762204.1 thiamine phosphate synthase [Bacteroidales bacterium]
MNRCNPLLYLVTDRALAKGRPIENVVEQAVKGGVTMVQLREKDCPTLEFFNLAVLIKRILAPFHVPLIINDRLDIALAADAEGLHIGQHDIPYVIARKILGKDKIIGLSVESISQAREANKLDVDYIGLSPVFVTDTKPELSIALGIEGVREIASFSRHCIVAIGGINARNAVDIVRAGADGIAVVSAIVSADDPMMAAREIRQKIATFKQ